MITNTIIVDDFYFNPHQVRNYVMGLPFNIVGNYPGARTEPHANDHVKRIIQDIIYPTAGNITNWDTEYNGCFQICTSADRTWIHADRYTKWAGVCYLTPDAPISSGTAFYRHKESGEYRFSGIDRPEAQDYTKWDMTDYVSNKFNRLILYRGDLYHASLDYFGYDLHTGRLFQTFFFDTEA